MGETIVRAAEWRDTEGVGDISNHNETHTLTSYSLTLSHSLTSTSTLTGRVTDCTHGDTASFSYTRGLVGSDFSSHRGQIEGRLDSVTWLGLF